jgi:hypothetical protein
VHAVAGAGAHGLFHSSLGVSMGSTVYWGALGSLVGARADPVRTYLLAWRVFTFERAEVRSSKVCARARYVGVELWCSASCTARLRVLCCGNWHCVCHVPGDRACALLLHVDVAQAHGRAGSQTLQGRTSQGAVAAAAAAFAWCNVLPCVTSPTQQC